MNSLLLNKKHHDAPPPPRDALRYLKLCLNNRAVSLTEALVAAGMVGGLSLGYLQLSGDHQKSQKKIEAGFEIDMLTLEMAQTLSNDDACTKTLRDKTSGTIPDVRNSADKAIFKEGKKYGQNLIQLKTLELKNLNKASDGFGSLDLEVTFEKTAKIIKGKKEEIRKIPLVIQESGGTVICNPDPATRYIASTAKKQMCDSIKGTFDPATGKCTPPFIGKGCPNYIVGFDSDGKAICETQYSFGSVSIPLSPPPPSPPAPPSPPTPPTPPVPPVPQVPCTKTCSSPIYKLDSSTCKCVCANQPQSNSQLKAMCNTHSIVCKVQGSASSFGQRTKWISKYGCDESCSSTSDKVKCSSVGANSKYWTHVKSSSCLGPPVCAHTGGFGLKVKATGQCACTSKSSYCSHFPSDSKCP